MLALYMTSLGIGAGIAGAFVHDVLSQHGYVLGEETGLAAALGGACGFAAVQGAYLVFVRFVYPTRDLTPFIIESLSNLTPLALWPFIQQWEIDWPHPILAKVAPLLFIGGFIALFMVLKFVSFYAFVSGRKASRLGAAGWLVFALLMGHTARSNVQDWLAALEAARPSVAEEMRGYEVGGTYARARTVPEGALLDEPIEMDSGMALTIRATPPTRDAFEALPDSEVYLTLRLDGAEPAVISNRIAIGPGGWTEVRVAPEDIPEGTTRCQVSWSTREAPVWQEYVKYRPISSTSQELLISGPHVHRAQAPEGPPNIILVAAEGLGARHVSRFGYPRAATPQLDRWSEDALVFSQAYTPAPDSQAACMTMLTGLTPMRHGYYGATAGRLPEYADSLAAQFQALGFATVAYTESGDGSDAPMGYGTHFARGFELFDTSYSAPAVPEADSEAEQTNVLTIRSLRDLLQWVQEDTPVQFMAFVRLRELSEFEMRSVYNAQFADAASSPKPVDIYDSALHYLDTQLGIFLERLRESKQLANTVVVVTGTHGYEFQGDSTPVLGVTEACLHVPVFMYVPGETPAMRSNMAALQDIPATLIGLAGGNPDAFVDGRDLLNEGNRYEVVSMQAKPLVLSLRAENWRATWSPEGSGWLGLFDMNQSTTRNVASIFPQVADRYRQRLEKIHSELLEQPPNWLRTAKSAN